MVVKTSPLPSEGAKDGVAVVATFSPAANFNGAAPVTCTATDALHQQTAEKTVTVIVGGACWVRGGWLGVCACTAAFSPSPDLALPRCPPPAAVNDVPVFANMTLTVTEDTPVAFDPLEAVVDVDGDTSVQSCSQPAHGTVTQAANGTWVYSPAADYNGAGRRGRGAERAGCLSSAGRASGQHRHPLHTHLHLGCCPARSLLQVPTSSRAT